MDAETPFSVSKSFTFLFMTLGPFKILGPFAQMAKDRNRAATAQLAFRGIAHAAGAVLAAATIGVLVLRSWGISPAALQLAAGFLVFLVALRAIMSQYNPRAQGPPPRATPLALAFPTIATPYGIAVVIMLVALRPEHLRDIALLIAFVFALNVIAMLAAKRILRTPFVATVFMILGTVMNVLMLALGIQVGAEALRVI